LLPLYLKKNIFGIQRRFDAKIENKSLCGQEIQKNRLGQNNEDEIRQKSYSDQENHQTQTAPEQGYTGPQGR
jgi:hypothetical protein